MVSSGKMAMPTLPVTVRVLPATTNGLRKGLADAVEAAVGDEAGRQVGGEIGGDDDELVAAEAGEGVGDADRVAEIAGHVLEELVADLVAE